MPKALATGLLFLILPFLLVGPSWAKDGPQTQARAPTDKIPYAVSERIATHGDARVIVQLNTPVVRERKLNPREKAAQRRLIADAQARFASELSAAGAVAEKVFNTVPAVALRADAAVLDVLMRSGLVGTVTLDLLSRPFLHESNLVIESDQMWTQSPAIKGAGHAVAILDTGVESGHSMFADGLGNSRVAAEFCASTSYTDGDGVVISTSLCPGEAATSSANGSGADCAAHISGCGHGTHVAGIAAGSPVALNVGTVSGVAPEADIIAVQVFSEFVQNAACDNSPPCALSFNSDQMVALEHVLSLQETGALNVASVNMSLGGGEYTASCDAESPTYLGVINNLVDAGIAVVIATGNASYTNAVASPACLSPAIAVGSTTKQDQVSSFSNVGDGLVDLYAPGSSIASAVLNDSFDYLSGTSMAAPHVAGAWALMHEATDDSLERGVELVLHRFQSTGTNVANRESGASVGFSVPRINIEQASESTYLDGQLTSASAVSNISANQGENLDYYIDVPAGIDALIISLDVGSGDPDMYVDTSFPPPTNAPQYDDPPYPLCASANSPGTDELCEISEPAEGRYYIRINAWQAFSGASITATLSAVPGTPSIDGITPGDGSLEVSFSPASVSDQVDNYAVSCVDQSPGRESLVTSGANLSEPHYVDKQPLNFYGRLYPSVQAFHNSRAFQEGAYRCATHEHDMFLQSQRNFSGIAATADCTNSLTNIDAQYDPVQGRTLIVPVYWHVIYRADGTGYVSRQRIDDQMAVLNDDFAGTSFGGDSGFNTTIQFELVSVDYVQDDDWYTDAGAGAVSEFKSSLAQSPDRFINVYTNDAGGGGTLGYATLPPGTAGTAGDGIVMLHDTIGGRNNGYGSFDQGRTLVHEVGHYLGLLHTFDGGVCSNTYTTQDLIVDTPAQSAPDYGTSASSACGVTSAIENFMNYSDDLAMYTFTEEQTNRMICSQTSYRPNGYSFETPGTFTSTGASSPLTVTGLTNGNTYACSVVATNSSGSSAASAAVNAVPAAPTAPGVPAITRTDYGDGEIYLYVTVSDDGGSAVTGYTALCTDGSATFTGTSTNSPITISGLTNETAYTCTVTATNAIGTSADSSATATITPEEGATGLPIWLLYQATQ